MNHSTEDNHLFEAAQQHPFQDDDEEDGEVYEEDNGEEINHQRRFSGEDSLYLGPDGREQSIPIPQAPTSTDDNYPHEPATHEQPHPQQQQFFFNYQQNLPSKITGASGASEQRTVDVLIIGGGPAALGVLVNAVKTNRLNELLQGDGLAIIDAGLNFGGGILGRYGINSNTSGGGFLKCAYKKTKSSKEKKATIPLEEVTEGAALNKILAESGISKKKGEKTSVVKKPNNAGGGGTGKRIEQPLTNPYAQQLAQSQKNFSAACGLPCFTENNNEILAPFRELYSSHIGRVLKDFGKNTAPLAVIGHYLNYAGNHLLSFIHQTTKKKIFFPLHKAVSIQLMSNGEILTKVKRQQLEITVTEVSESLRIIDTDQVVVFRSRVLIVANGGVQGLHPELFNWFPNVDKEKVMASDDFLRSEGYHRGLSLLKDKKKKRVVIIGGSHSGFSCAWMLLNGPAAYYRNNAGLFIDREPSAIRKSVKNCMDCCQCGIVLANMKRAKAQKEAKQQEGMTSPAKAGKEQQQCNCLCVCFGLFDYDDWKFETGEGLPVFEEASIQILYREQIKVFYNKVSDAEKDGYNQFEADKFSKKDGYLYSFSGLRGDAKDLYLRIMRGQEKRVTLIQARDATEQRPYVDQADLVLWCCGYQTNAIPFKDVDRKKLQLSQKVPNTQFDVDGKCRILTSDNHALAKCFACGIAYPVRTKDGMLVSNPTMSNPRADGFSLYMNFVGDQILKGVVPKGKMIRSTVHKVSTVKAGGQENGGGGIMGDGGTFTKSKYQQVLKARIQQYRHKNTEDDKQRNKSMHVPKKQPQNHQDDEDSLERDHNIDQLLSRPSYPAQLPTEGPSEDQQEQEGSIQPQHDAKKIMSIRDLNKAHAAKSVDRGMKGAFQNKFSQMARSPQILQRKQEQIMKMKQESSELLNHDLADLIIAGSAEENQIIAVSAMPQKGKKFHGKSPYNNNMKYSRQPSQQEGKGLGSSGKPNRGQGVGREVLRSSQGQNRKLDNILAQQAKASSEDPGIFKMSRSSQVSFNNKQQQQRNGRGSIVNVAATDMMYNSIGSAIGPSNLFNQSTFDQKSSRQGGNGAPGTLKRVELPPILHPLSQNHYVHIPPQSAESLNRGEANDDYLPEGKCSIIKKPFDSKSMRGSSLQTSTLPGGGQEDLHPQSQQQNSRKPKPRENPMLRDNNNRPLSDNQREDIVHEVVSSNGQQLQKKNTLIKKKSAGRRNIKLNQKTPETEVKTQRRVERISSLEEEEEMIRQKEMVRPNQPSPSPYENEGFDADDGDIDEHQDLGHDDSHIDNYDEDVSSEGSCRTSIYNRSQRGDDDDSHKQGSSSHTGGENTKASSLHQRGEDSSKKTVESSNRGNLDKISSKYSFQSKIPRLIKPGRIEEAPAVQAKGKFVQVKAESPALHEGKLIKRQTGGVGKEQSEARKIGGGIKQLIENDDASKSALLEVILSNQQSKLPPSQQQQSRKHTRANNAVQAASQQQMIPGAQQFSHKINQVRQNAINNSNAASMGGAGHPSTNGSQMVVKKPHVNEVTATKGLKEVAK